MAVTEQFTRISGRLHPGSAAGSRDIKEVSATLAQAGIGISTSSRSMRTTALCAHSKSSGPALPHRSDIPGLGNRPPINASASAFGTTAHPERLTSRKAHGRRCGRAPHHRERLNTITDQYCGSLCPRHCEMGIVMKTPPESTSTKPRVMTVAPAPSQPEPWSDLSSADRLYACGTTAAHSIPCGAQREDLSRSRSARSLPLAG